MLTFAIFTVFCVIFALLIANAWTDHKLYILPNEYNFGLLVCFIALTYMLDGDWYSAMLGSIIGGGFLLLVRAVANKAMGQDNTVGLGDVKLMIAAGFGVGMPDVFLVLSIGAFLGILHGATLQEAERRKTGTRPPLMTVNVPAGVGLCIATAGFVAYDLYYFSKGAF